MAYPHNCGRPVLYLNSVWKTYTGVRRRCIDNQHWYISSFRDVKPLQLVATNHPLSNKSSPKSSTLQKLATLIESFMANNLDSDSDILSLRSNSESQEGAASTTAHQLDIPQKLVCLLINERRVEVFARFVMDCLYIFLGRGEINLTLKKANAMPDKLMPF